MTPGDWENFSSLAGLTIAIAVAIVAGAQWWLARKTENRERAQRVADETSAIEAAHAALWAEWFRLWTLSRRFADGDLLALAASKRLNPSDLLPKDWAAATANLAKLGPASSYMGGYAFGLAHDAADLAFEITADVAALPGYSHSQPQNLSDFVEAMNPTLRVKEERLRTLALEVANLLQDALEHAAGMPRDRIIRFNEDLHSFSAKRMKSRAALRAASVDSTKSLTDELLDNPD